MNSNATYTISLGAINIGPTADQFIGNFQFELGDSAGTYFITGVRAVCYVFDIIGVTGPEYRFPTMGIVKLNTSAAGVLTPQAMTRRAKITLDDFSNDASTDQALIIPINLDTIDLGYGLQVRGNQELNVNLFTQFTAFNGGDGTLTFHLLLNVYSPQDMGSPQPVKGMLKVPARTTPVK